MVADGPPVAETDSITSGYIVPCASHLTSLISAASSSKTSINLEPIAFLFFSGSETPFKTL